MNEEIDYTARIIARRRELGYAVTLPGDIIALPVDKVCQNCHKRNPYGSFLQPRLGAEETESYCQNCGIAFENESGKVTKAPSMSVSICPDRHYHHLGSKCETCGQNG